jgi:predicted transposase/invertase (TIGR01784 family)
MNHKYRLGKEEGLAAGKAEGKAESALEIARRLKELGLPGEQIASSTGLPLEAVEKI